MGGLTKATLLEQPASNGRDANGDPNTTSTGIAGAAGKDDSGPHHLIVLVYGVGGSHANWSYTKHQLESSLGPDFLVFCSHSVKNPTLGIDVLGNKLASEIRVVVRQHPSLKKISIIGHSLGGVVSRYALSRLLDDPAVSTSKHEAHQTCQEPVLARPDSQNDAASSHDHHKALLLRKEPKGSHRDAKSQHDYGVSLRSLSPITETASVSDSESRGLRIAGLEPVNFITLASPHLGSRGKTNLPVLAIVSFLEKASPTLAPWFLGTTAKQLFLQDGPQPLLLEMSTDSHAGKFLTALSAFKHRAVYANVAGDQMVGWPTSSIRQASEMPKIESLREDPGYKYISTSLSREPNGMPLSVKAANSAAVQSQSLGIFRKIPEEEVRSSFRRSKSSMLDQTFTNSDDLEDTIAENLSHLDWERVDVNFSALALSFLAHNLIQVKDFWIHKAGASVIQHVIDHLER